MGHKALWWRAIVILGLFYIFTFRLSLNIPKAETVEHQFRVATVNAWNFEGDWKMRMMAICDLMERHQISIIGIQEIRISESFHQISITNSNAAPLSNQLEVLQKFLPSFPHHVFQASHTAKDYTEESHCELDYTFPGGYWMCTLRIGPTQTWYNVVNQLKYVDDASGPIESIIMGDYNTYYDFEYPMDLMTMGPHVKSKCDAIWSRMRWSGYSHNWQPLRDVWRTIRGEEPGLTFVVDKTVTPSLDSCRPDRILTNGMSFAETDVYLLGPHHDMIEDRKMSDHLLVVANFHWGGSAVGIPDYLNTGLFLVDKHKVRGVKAPKGQEDEADLSDLADWIEGCWLRMTESGSCEALSIPRSLDMISTSGPFQLMEPLRRRQRKSYEGENRFITPKPVIVFSQDSNDLFRRVERCSVKVVLADRDGTPLACQDLITGPQGVDAEMSLPFKRTPPMLIKISHQLEEHVVRLSFAIEYTVDGQMQRSTILSDCFVFARFRKRRRVSDPFRRRQNQIEIENMM
ncbi:hypothetical protein PROFUN_04817 [Planoprotostelium fungivorum]|uniref:Endonuclease/exonuclease/phosphatase domain-containing protein n=1 Tax=Planoprotostelium fungivorum TaxID=1890364 RepID=A0A2P6NT11_9EUKA|nr:hypothetical protein PROFUN_04817 [Planoprotostelium fungivorum]